MHPNRTRFLCFFFLLFALAFTAATIAQAGTCCVWRVTSVPQPFYLVGTIHALSGSDYPLPKPYDQALHDSKQLFFEIDPHLNAEIDFAKKFDVAAAYPKGDDIRRHVHGETYVFLHKNLGYSGLLGYVSRFGYHHISGIEQLRPWAIAYYVWGVRGYNDVFQENGVDAHLSFEAKRMGKERKGLETAQEHVEVLAGMNDIESELILLDALVRGDKRRDDFNRERADWKRGDTKALWAELQRFRKLDPGADVRLLDIRNVKWIPKIKAEMKSGVPTSIVVGAGHMLGPNGLVAILEREGYKIEQL
jgi:uncharacterized protein